MHAIMLRVYKIHRPTVTNPSMSNLDNILPTLTDHMTIHPFITYSTFCIWALICFVIVTLASFWRLDLEMLRLTCAVGKPVYQIWIFMTLHLIIYKHRWHKKQYVNFFSSCASFRHWHFIWAIFLLSSNTIWTAVINYGVFGIRVLWGLMTFDIWLGNDVISILL